MLSILLATLAVAGCSTITRESLTPCALAQSAAIAEERHTLGAAEAQLKGSRFVLPSNPGIDLSGAYRQATRAADPAAWNWYVTLRQEIEISGQRAARLNAATADRDAEQQTLQITTRQTLADAWQRYFAVLAAEEELRLVTELTESAKGVAKSTRASAEKGILSPLDADMALATLSRFQRSAFAAQRKRFEAKEALASQLRTTSDALQISGSLTPLSAPATHARTDTFPEAQRLHLEERAHTARASLARRLRIPNPTLSFFAQNDGFDERVFGLGLSFPIPLPEPVGRTNAGLIASEVALAERSRVQTDAATRALKAQLGIAQNAFSSRKGEVSIFTPDALARAHKQLLSLAEEISGGRLTVREASVAQLSLVEFLLSHIDAELQLCLASVLLSRAANVALEEGPL